MVFEEGDKVYVRLFRGKKRWLPAKITKVMGKLMYEVRDLQGQVSRRHIDHLRGRHVEVVEANTEGCSEGDDWPYFPMRPRNELLHPNSEQSSLRRSTRVRRPVDRFVPNGTH